jgi:hypothetical protein
MTEALIALLTALLTYFGPQLKISEDWLPLTCAAATVVKDLSCSAAEARDLPVRSCGTLGLPNKRGELEPLVVGEFWLEEKPKKRVTVVHRRGSGGKFTVPWPYEDVARVVKAADC